MRRAQKARPPGVSEIAELAGVSIATVSRALNRPDLVRRETVDKVQRVAETLGYLTKAAGAAPILPSSGTVALILPTVENSIFSEMIGSLTRTLIGFGRTLVVAAHNYDQAEEVRILRAVIDRRVEGVVLIGNDHNIAVSNLIHAAKIPVVEAWHYSVDSANATVGIDNKLAGQMIARHCLGHPARHFGIVFPNIDLNDRAAGRRQGVLEVFQEANIPLAADCDFICGYNIDHAKALALDILSKPGPRSFICGNDVIALGFLFAAQQLALDVPHQVRIAGIGDFSFARSTVPGLTTVRIPAKTIGREVAELITRMIDRPISEDFPSIQIQPTLVVRGSCGVAPM